MRSGWTSLLTTSLVTLAVIASLLSPREAHAQSCDARWTVVPGIGNTGGFVSAMTMWDPDGEGPSAPNLVVAGTFVINSGAFVHQVAMRDAVTGAWMQLGGNITNGSQTASANALVVLRDNTLVLAGSFSAVGSTPVSNIARLMNNGWTPLGFGLNGTVAALAVLSNGDLIAGGSFSTHGNNVARWNGTAWSALGSGLNSTVTSLAVMADERVVAGGSFTQSGTQTVRYIGFWNSLTSTWSGLPASPNNPVDCLAALPEGGFVAGGSFTSVDGLPANRVALFDGRRWTAMGDGFLAPVRSLLGLPGGVVIAGGDFTSSGSTTVNRIARWIDGAWRGTSFSTSAGTNGAVRSLVSLGGNQVVVGGQFLFAGNQSARLVAELDWLQFPSIVNQPIAQEIDAGETLTLTFEANSPATGVQWFRTNDPITEGPGGASPSGGVVSLSSDASGTLHTLTIAGVQPRDSGAYSARLSLNCDTRSLVATSKAAVVNVNNHPCAEQWLKGEAEVQGLNAAARAMMLWDADGAGPQLPKLVVGGDFTNAVGVSARGVAVFDLITKEWSAMGAGLNSPVRAIAVLPSNELVVAGDFTTSGSATVSRIARWDGSNWVPLGTGFNSTVRALAVLPSGELVAGGNFTTAGGVSAGKVARWNGTSWSAFGSGVNSTGEVYAMAVMPNGDFVAGGTFNSIGGVVVNGIARWNGSNWTSLGTGVSSSSVYALCVLPNGDLIAAGGFSTAGGVRSSPSIARWNGTEWLPLSTGINFFVYALAALPNGDVIAGGAFSNAGGVSVQRVARWNGTTWSPMGFNLSNDVLCLAVLPDGDVVAGGTMTELRSIARWDGERWNRFSFAVSNEILAIAEHPTGDLIAGGRFNFAGEASASRIARWNGSSWSSLGSGASGDVYALVCTPNGDVIAGGGFTTAGGVTANRIARWNGSTWSALGTGVNASVVALALLPNGDIVAGGGFTTAGGVPANRIARWNGSTWEPLGSGMNSNVYSLTVTPNGDVVAGGDFSAAGGVSAGGIARWNGSAWTPLGEGISGESPLVVRAVVALPNGDIVAGGNFFVVGNTPVSNVARWNGSAWNRMGFGVNSTVYSLDVLPDGDVVAGGSFLLADGLSASKIARWNGASWESLDDGLDFQTVYALAALPTGELAVGGNFRNAGGDPSAYFARYTFTGIPTISIQPQSQVFASNQTLTLSAIPSSGYRNVHVQWQRNGVNITEGSGGASMGGGFVSGASGALASPTRVTPAILTIANAQDSDAGSYTAIFSTACGSITTAPAIASIAAPPCDTIDFNNDQIFPTDEDVIDFFSVLAGGACTNDPNCNDIDFNNDGLFPDDNDLLAFLRVLAGGEC